jgi:zinc transporter ZupT
MATHVLTTDFGLRQDHRRRYDRFGRWIIAAAVMAGWAIAAVTRLPDLAIGLLFAFLAGGIVLNVLKEELPEERKSRFLPFLAGVVGYSLVLAAI